jgi:hypothetical protein
VIDWRDEPQVFTTDWYWMRLRRIEYARIRSRMTRWERVKRRLDRVLDGIDVCIIRGLLVVGIAVVGMYDDAREWWRARKDRRRKPLT